MADDEWKKAACQWCRGGCGYQLLGTGKRIHFGGWACTAPTEAEHIAQLTARVAELEAQIDSAVKPRATVHIGTSCLSKDLVWCECGRGLSLHGKWTFCPNCGREIDQGSYAHSVDQATINGAYLYRDAASDEAIIAVEAENAMLRTPPDNAAWRSIVEYAYKIGGEGVRHVESITGHYVAMRERVVKLEMECGASGLRIVQTEAANARLRTALEEMEAEFRATPVTIQRVPRKIKLLASAWEALKADIATPALSSAPVAAEVERQQADPIRKALERIVAANAELIESQDAWGRQFEEEGITVGDPACIRRELAQKEFYVALAAAEKL